MEIRGILLNLGVIILTFLFYVYSRYILVAYVKLSPEGVEQRIWFANPTRYPINAIDNVTYFETPDIDDQRLWLVSTLVPEGKLP